MKRKKSKLSVLLSFLIVISMSLATIPTAYADTIFTDENTGIVFSNEPYFEASIYRYDGTNPDVVLPPDFVTRKVTFIHSKAFYENKVVRTITMPDTIKKIDYWAFMYAENLESVKVSPNVEAVGENLFTFCKSLTDADFSNTKITEVSANMFQDTAITSTKLPNTVNTIGVAAFANCSKLVEADLPESVTSISKSAFLNCENLEKVFIGKNCTELADNIFINSPNVVIYGYNNSDAQQYAADNGIEFVSIDSIDNSYLKSAVQTAELIIADENSPYTQETLDNLKTVYALSKAVLDSHFSTQAEIDEALSALNQAVSALELKPTEPETTEPETTEPETTEPTTTEPTEPTTVVTEPTTDATEPTTVVTEPTTDTTESTTDVTEPTTVVTEPTTDATEPTTVVTEPTTDATEPTTGTTEPSTDDELSDRLYGDANGDGKINVKDATEIQRSIAGIITLSDVQSVCADVNLDGKVNIVDVTNIQRFSANFEIPNIGNKIPLAKLPK